MKNTEYTFDQAPNQNWQPQFTYLPGINAQPIDSKFLK